MTNAFAPGIGIPGQRILTQYGTRILYVHSTLVTSFSELTQLASELVYARSEEEEYSLVTRRVLKCLVNFSVFAGQILSSGMVIESCPDFLTLSGQHLYWIEAGINTGERLEAMNLYRSVFERQVKYVQTVETEPGYACQSGKLLLSYVWKANPDFSDCYLVRVISRNFDHYTDGLKNVLQVSFSEYPGDPFQDMREGCDRNIILIAVGMIKGQETVLSVTGVEYLSLINGVRVGEVGPSASISSAKGFGALMKRALIARIIESDRKLDLAFTESLCAKTIPTSARSGFIVNSKFMLPLHTNIDSRKDPGIDGANQIFLTGCNGLFEIETMTMTYASQRRMCEVISEYGDIPYSSVRNEEGEDRYYLG